MAQNTTPEFTTAADEAWGRLSTEDETGFTADPYAMFEAGWVGHAKQSEELVKFVQADLSQLKKLTARTIQEQQVVIDDLQSRYDSAHAELLAIHDILICIGECPVITPEDTFCVGGVKELVQRAHQ